jgi:hypothetical protein|tara:strand:+ start:822 stop:1037 length:216 start_codon:yes stop_codon:yes gene_type:complete
MEIIMKISLRNFDAWAGAKDTKQLILDNNKEDEFEFLMEDLYPDGMTDTKLNDILWFEEDWICEMLAIDND